MSYEQQRQDAGGVPRAMLGLMIEVLHAAVQQLGCGAVLCGRWGCASSEGGQGGVMQLQHWPAQAAPQLVLPAACCCAACQGCNTL